MKTKYTKRYKENNRGKSLSVESSADSWVVGGGLDADGRLVMISAESVVKPSEPLGYYMNTKNNFK